LSVVSHVSETVSQEDFFNLTKLSIDKITYVASMAGWIYTRAHSIIKKLLVKCGYMCKTPMWL